VNAPAQDMTEETLAQIQKAQSAGILESTGIWNYDLSGLVSLIPVVTPFRDLVSRTKATKGNPFAVWRALMNITSSQATPAMGFDYAANEVQFDEQDFQARYMPTGYSGLATQDAYDLGLGYADPYAVSTFQTLNQVLIGDDRMELGAQSFPLKAASAPTLSTATTGGTIDENTTVYVGVAARTISGYFYGGGNSQGDSADIETGGSTNTNTVSAVAVAQHGAVAYDWFQSSNGTTWYYYTTTTTNTVTMTKVITQNQALPDLPDLSQNWQGTAGAVPTYTSSEDNGSGQDSEYDGFLASLSGDYNGSGQWAQPGTGSANPSVWNNLNGAALTLDGGSVAEIEEYLFLPLWNAVKCSPTAIMVNAAQAQEIANLILAQPSAVTYLQTDESGRVNVTGGGRVGSLVNAPAGGIVVPIEVHVSLPPGTIIARTDRVPFPQANIGSVLEQRCLRDTAQFDYGIARVAGTKGGGPRREFEIRSVSAFANKAPVAMGVLSNVA